jgi:predicted NBD/HSP70 family sugar kinase
MTTRAFLGIDVGGTTTSAGLVTAQGRVVLSRNRPTHGPGGGDAVPRLLALAAEVAGLARPRGYRVVGVGAGVPGIVDGATGAIGGEAHNVPELGGVPLARLLTRALGVPASGRGGPDAARAPSSSSRSGREWAAASCSTGSSIAAPPASAASWAMCR